MTVICIDCGNSVELKDGKLRDHRRTPGKGGPWCAMSDKPFSANQRRRNDGVEQRNPGDMHEPKPYTGELDWGTHADHVTL